MSITVQNICFYFVRQQWNFLYMGDIREEARAIISRYCRAVFLRSSDVGFSQP